MTQTITYCGFIAIVGRPNVGKSTLLNRLIGKKISITSNKPHTTHHRIMGVHTEGVYQTIYIDTPGLHATEKNRTYDVMRRHTINLINDVTLVVFMIEGIRWTASDEMILKNLQNTQSVLLVINKMDVISNKSILLPHLQHLDKQRNFIGIVPISAQRGENIGLIKNIICQYLPKAKHCFPQAYITDCSQKFMASEIIREKIMRGFGAELPYSVVVQIEKFITNTRGVLMVYALIVVQSEGQKKIMIGAQGGKIKTIGVLARQNMEKVFGQKVYLQNWVKVQHSWADHASVLHNLEHTNYLQYH
ncbi:GTPase Era [Candidatus Erwinia haradaeae]|uniref:GTPase Era n=1 Tax=Candidatus Erwinia haradaeae TaxID=1922217 RepID=A0A451DC27_9GAMM|nr:GTPase Era [Candidatus Erwinia haradaeae]VFP83965.1 GTPase Era [Candidatus Erwinia haradaeae]